MPTKLGGRGGTSADCTHVLRPDGQFELLAAVLLSFLHQLAGVDALVAARRTMFDPVGDGAVTEA